MPDTIDLQNIIGFIQTRTEAPSYVPQRFQDQFVLVTAGGSTSAYIYDINATSWKYVTLT